MTGRLVMRSSRNLARHGGLPHAIPSLAEKTMAKMKKLEDLFHDTLKDVYFAEKKILASLPKMAKAAQHTGLKAAFDPEGILNPGRMYANL